MPEKTDSPQIEQIQAALALFLEAWDYANDAGQKPWDFAIEIADLVKPDGISKSCLLWLIYKGYLEQQHETVSTDYLRRKFSAPSNGLTFTQESCFSLTQAGELYAREILGSVQPTVDINIYEQRADQYHQAGSEETIPSWDVQRRELKLGPYVVKQFKVPAPNQQLVLSVFEESQWPTRIDDPLPPKSEIDCKRRLHDTISSLNRHRKAPLLTFHGDGQGNGVIWTEKPLPTCDCRRIRRFMSRRDTRSCRPPCLPQFSCSGVPCEASNSNEKRH